MNKVHQMLHGIFEFKKNIETWNKQTLNLTMMLQTKCRVRQSWATCCFLVHLGYA